jgi:transcriptional regulator with XRE-family HTH domain
MLLKSHNYEVIIMPETEFWTAFKELCDQNGTSPNAVAKELGLSSGSITAWKNGRTPQFTTIGRIAARFGVGMERFYGLAETEKAPAEPAGATEEEVRFALFGDAPITDEDFENVKAFADLVAERARKRQKKTE